MRPRDTILVWRLRNGDREAYRDLIRSHHHGVYGYLRRLGAGPFLAEDLTQETYARAWQRIETLRKSASLRSWLMTIARNEYLQSVRAGRQGTAGTERLPEMEDPSPGPEGEVVLTERDRRVRRAVAQLEGPLQEALALHYFQDLSLREVGAVLGIPAGTVKSRIHRALECLRKLLEEKETDDEREGTEKAIAGHS